MPLERYSEKVKLNDKRIYCNISVNLMATPGFRRLCECTEQYGSRSSEGWSQGRRSRGDGGCIQSNQSGWVGHVMYTPSQINLNKGIVLSYTLCVRSMYSEILQILFKISAKISAHFGRLLFGIFPSSVELLIHTAKQRTT